MENDHQYYEENHFVDNYVLGKLSQEEEEQFEDHFIACNQCTQAIELAEQLTSTLKESFPKGLPLEPEPSKSGVRSWFPFSPLLQGTLSVLFLASLASLLLITQNVRTQKNQIRHYQEQVGTLLEHVQALENATHTTPSFFLDHVRGTKDEAAVLQLSSEQPFFTVQVDLNFSEFNQYRAFFEHKGQEVLSLQNVIPDSDHKLTFHLSQDLLEPGSYVLHIQGALENGEFVPVEQYPFALKTSGW